MAIASLLGTAISFFGGWVERVGMWLLDMLLVVPSFLLIAMIVRTANATTGWIWLIIGLTAFGWVGYARIIRTLTLSLRERDFMLATRVLGLSARRRLFGHLLPNTIPILVVMATMAVANAILSESALSYLGLGVVPPTPSWGNMMDAANSLIDFQRRPWLWMPPGIAIFITVIAINVLGDGLRDAMDPKMKQRRK